jgi:hypothetical protein
MLNVILVSVMAVCFIVGLVTLFFPFGKESVKAVNGAPAVKSAAQISLEEIRDQARTSTDIQILVVWFKGFYGYNSQIPSSVRYLHMMEWRTIVDERYKELPAEIAPLWMILVNRNPGAFSGGWK